MAPSAMQTGAAARGARFALEIGTALTSGARTVFGISFQALPENFRRTSTFDIQGLVRQRKLFMPV